MSDSNGWEGVLRENEKVVWQGRPGEAVIKFRVALSILLGFGLLAATVLFLILVVFTNPNPTPLPVLAFLLGFAVLAGLGIYRLQHDIRHTWYSLTTQRAIIAKKAFLKGKTLDSYWYTHDRGIEVKGGSVFVGTRLVERKRHDVRVIPVAFEKIPNPEYVADLMRTYQEKWVREQAGESEP